MVRLQFSIELQYAIAAPGCDFIFSIHAAQTPQQRIVQESLQLSYPLPSSTYTDPHTQTRYLRLKSGPGALSVRYAATVDVDHHQADPALIDEVAVADLPGDVLPYLYPSRYCQSDRLLRFAALEFGHLWRGYRRVQAIRDWVVERVTFRSNSSNSNTSAVDTLVEKGLREQYIVLVGGAPLNEEFGKAIGADAYCRDAAVAVETAKRMMARKHNQVAAG